MAIGLNIDFINMEINFNSPTISMVDSAIKCNGIWGNVFIYSDFNNNTLFNFYWREI